MGHNGHGWAVHAVALLLLLLLCTATGALTADELGRMPRLALESLALDLYNELERTRPAHALPLGTLAAGAGDAASAAQPGAAGTEEPSFRGVGECPAGSGTRAALTSLWQATGGETGAWKESFGWGNASVSVCEWRPGVAFSNGGFSVRLNGNGLSGTIPDQLFTRWGTGGSLAQLDLGSNPKLSGTLPRALATACNLTMLNLEWCSLSGTLPPEWSALSSLRALNVAHNAIEGALPDSWAPAMSAALVYLELGDNRLSGTLPHSWRYFQSLADLRAPNNALNGSLPAVWYYMRNLRALDLSNNSISGVLPREWTWLPILQDLYLSHNVLSGSIPQEWSTGRAPLPKLRLLDLADNALTAVDRSLPPALSTLILDDNRLTRVVIDGRGDTLLLRVLRMARNRLVSCPDVGFIPLVMLDVSDNPLLSGSCEGRMGPAFPYSLELLLASGTNLSNIDWKPRMARMLDVRNCASLEVLPALPPTCLLTSLFATGCPLLRARGARAALTPASLDHNELYRDYAGRAWSSGKEGVLPAGFFVGGLSAVADTDAHLCPMLQTAAEGVPAAVDPTFYLWWPCACAPGWSGLPPRCTPCDTALQACGRPGTVCPAAMPGHWTDYGSGEGEAVPAPRSAEQWNSGMCGAVERGPEFDAPRGVFKCRTIAYHLTACNNAGDAPAAWRSNTCAEGYMGRLCSACQPGFGHTGPFVCNACDGRATWLYPTVTLAGVVAQAAWVLFSSPRPSGSAGVTIALFAWQAVAQLTPLGVPSERDDEVSRTVLPVALQWASLGVLNGECADLTLPLQFVLAAAMPWLTGLCVLLYSAGASAAWWTYDTRSIPGAAATAVQRRRRGNLAAAYVAYSMYVPAAAWCLRVLHCDGTDHLEAAPYFGPCPLGPSSPNVWMAVVALANLAVGTVGAFALLLHVQRRVGVDKVLASSAVSQLVAPFKARLQWWAWISLVRQVLFTLLVGAAGVTSPAFAPAVGALLAGNAAGVWRFAPYARPDDNAAEALSLGALAVVFTGSGVLLVWPATTHGPTVGTALHWVGNVTTAALALWVVAQQREALASSARWCCGYCRGRVRPVGVARGDGAWSAGDNKRERLLGGMGVTDGEPAARLSVA